MPSARSTAGRLSTKRRPRGPPSRSAFLPTTHSEARDRVAAPGEFASLLGRLAPEDALPWALAGYGTACSQEIRALEWPEVDFERDVMLLADSDAARKSAAARRIVFETFLAEREDEESGGSPSIAAR